MTERKNELNRFNQFEKESDKMGKKAIWLQIRERLEIKETNHIERRMKGNQMWAQFGNANEQQQ